MCLHAHHRFAVRLVSSTWDCEGFTKPWAHSCEIRRTFGSQKQRATVVASLTEEMEVSEV